MRNSLRHIIYLLGVIIVSSCSTAKETIKEDKIIPMPTSSYSSNEVAKDYTGWWVYGEGQHLFKDEETLEEWDLEFPNEDMEELKELYLAVCEMEYFPMECKIAGVLKDNKILIVDSFEILYIQGCGE